MNGVIFFREIAFPAQLDLNPLQVHWVGEEVSKLEEMVWNIGYQATRIEFVAFLA